MLYTRGHQVRSWRVGVPAEFSSNPNQTHLKQLIKVLLGILQTSRQVCWGKLELNYAGHRPSRIKFDDPCYTLIGIPCTNSRTPCNSLTNHQGFTNPTLGNPVAYTRQSPFLRINSTSFCFYLAYYLYALSWDRVVRWWFNYFSISKLKLTL